MVDALTIWKFPLEVRDRQAIQMPSGARVLCVQSQRERVCLWALVNPAADNVKRWVRIVGTGIAIVPSTVSDDYIGTFQTHRETFVWHVFVAKE